MEAPVRGNEPAGPPEQQVQQQQQQQEVAKQQYTEMAKFAPKRNRGNIRKRPDPAEEEQQGGGAGPSDAASSAGGREQQGVVRQAKVARAGEPLTFSNKREGAEEVHVTYESNKAIQSGRDNKVTSYIETETDTSHDARCGGRSQAYRDDVQV
jgi:hypothetical protein